MLCVFVVRQYTLTPISLETTNNNSVFEWHNLESTRNLWYKCNKVDITHLMKIIVRSTVQYSFCIEINCVSAMVK